MQDDQLAADQRIDGKLDPAVILMVGQLNPAWFEGSTNDRRSGAQSDRDLSDRVELFDHFHRRRGTAAKVSDSPTRLLVSKEKVNNLALFEWLPPKREACTRGKIRPNHLIVTQKCIEDAQDMFLVGDGSSFSIESKNRMRQVDEVSMPDAQIVP